MRMSTGLLIFFCAAGLTGCCCRTPAEPTAPVSGGFIPAEPDERSVVQAAGFAAEKIAAAQSWEGGAPSYAVKEAYSQVVAGVNYLLLINIEKEGMSNDYSALVWQKLSGEHELVSWEKL